MFSRCQYIIWLTWRRIVQRPALSVLLLLAIVYVIACLVIMSCEHTGIGSAALKAFPAFFGEVGEIETPITAVQVSIVIGILASATFIVILTAKITSVLVESIRRGGSMAKKVRFSDHTIICGWNFQGKRVIEELLAATAKKQRGIVILTDFDERPLEEPRVEFIKGDPASDDDLKNAGIERADSVIVLTDFTQDANTADAQALMITLAVESLNPEVHTCVQIMNSDNALHLRHAHADEIICLDQMGGSLAVASALHHGVSKIVSELLTFNEGSEIYRYNHPLPDKIVDKEYSVIAQSLAQQRMILLAVETVDDEEAKKLEGVDILHKLPEKGRAIVVNPQSNYMIRKDDALFIAAESEPTNL